MDLATPPDQKVREEMIELFKKENRSKDQFKNAVHKAIIKGIEDGLMVYKGGGVVQLTTLGALHSGRATRA
jgi:hypothetical protein